LGVVLCKRGRSIWQVVETLSYSATKNNTQAESSFGNINYRAKHFNTGLPREAESASFAMTMKNYL
jgi:hypothetical protein